MAPAARTAPKSRTAAFRSLDHQTVGIADVSRRDCSAGSGRKTESQRDTQKDRSFHPVFLPACMKLAAPVIELIHGTLGNIFLVEGTKASTPQGVKPSAKGISAKPGTSLIQELH
jgi:hypothetical protein